MCNMTHKIVYSINVYYINIIVYMYKYVCMLVLLLQLILLVTPDNIKTIYITLLHSNCTIDIKLFLKFCITVFIMSFFILQLCICSINNYNVI